MSGRRGKGRTGRVLNASFTFAVRELWLFGEFGPRKLRTRRSACATRAAVSRAFAMSSFDALASELAPRGRLGQFSARSPDTARSLWQAISLAAERVLAALGRLHQRPEMLAVCPMPCPNPSLH